MEFDLDAEKEKLDALTAQQIEFCKNCHDILTIPAGRNLIAYLEEHFLKGPVVTSDSLVAAALREGERNLIRRFIQGKNIYTNHIKK